jgi:hypothetical protein
VTFNNLHGTLKDVDTFDGLYYRSRRSEMGALEKVKLNMSEPWTTKDVWEYGAWEVCKKPLSWHRCVHTCQVKYQSYFAPGKGLKFCTTFYRLLITPACRFNHVK